jgi:hypothetical protein
MRAGSLGHFADGAIDRVWRRDIAIPHEERHGRTIDVKRCANCPDCLQLACKDKLLAKPTEVERLLSSMIRCEPKTSVPNIERNHREHPRKSWYRPLKPFFGNALKNDFGVTVAAPWDLHSRKNLRAQLLEIIHLSIERNDPIAAPTDHRLMPRLRDIEDRQSPMGKTDLQRWRPPLTVIIRASMSDPIAHLAEEVHRVSHSPRRIKYARNPTHSRSVHRAILLTG